MSCRMSSGVRAILRCAVTDEQTELFVRALNQTPLVTCLADLNLARFS